MNYSLFAIVGLIALGFNHKDLAKIHGPIGLDIKAKNPAEILKFFL